MSNGRERYLSTIISFKKMTLCHNSPVKTCWMTKNSEMPVWLVFWCRLRFLKPVSPAPIAVFDVISMLARCHRNNITSHHFKLLTCTARSALCKFISSNYFNCLIRNKPNHSNWFKWKSNCQPTSNVRMFWSMNDIFKSRKKISFQVESERVPVWQVTIGEIKCRSYKLC